MRFRKIKKLLVLILLVSIVLLFGINKKIVKANTIDEEKIYCNATLEDEFVDNEIFITLKNEESLIFNEYTINDFSEINCVSIDDLTDGYKDKIIEQLNGTYIGNMPVNLETFNRILKLTLSVNSKQYVLDAIKKLEALDYIKSAEPNYIIEMENLGSPNDFYYNNPLDLESSAWVYDSMNMEEAWEYYDEIEHYEKNIVKVGIFDTGVKREHEDLCWKDELGHITSSVFSDDGKNIGDGIGGFLSDDDGHGTMVAGIIAAYRNNEIGIAGVCTHAQIVSLRATFDNGTFNDYIEGLIECIEYAEGNNIRIINCSRGWDTYSSTLQAAISNYSGLLICGAGNSNINNDVTPVYPASYLLDNIISVGSSNEYNNQCTYEVDLITASNYGLNSVDLFAPGKNIISTYYDGGYNSDSGTSYATPFVTGVAALILSIAPDLSISELKTTILYNVTPISSLSNKCVTGGILNAEAAVKNIHRHSYTYTYDTTLYHHGECSCGVVCMEPHIWINVFPNSKRCIGCGETILVINNIKEEEVY